MTGGQPADRVAGGQPAGRIAGGGQVARAVVVVLTVVGLALLAASTGLELANTRPGVELATGVGASVVFLAEMVLRRGDGTRVLDLRARLLVGAGLSTLLAVAALWHLTERPAPGVLLLLIPVCLLFATAAFAIREADVQRHRMRQREIRARLDGEDAERRRWVRELHDDTLQELAAVMVVLGAAAASDSTDVRARGIADAREVVGRQIQALRRLIAQMRPLALDTLGLDAAIEDLARHARETTGVDIEVYAQDLPRLPIDTETSLYRIVQEALTNAVRHSGAGRVTVEAYGHPDGIEVAVRDNGAGPPSRGFVHGHGLTGMRERADAIGARLDIASAAGGGTIVRLAMPFPDGAARAGFRAG